jgi:hypothetical protein
MVGYTYTISRETVAMSREHVTMLTMYDYVLCFVLVDWTYGLNCLNTNIVSCILYLVTMLGATLTIPYHITRQNVPCHLKNRYVCVISYVQ